MKRWLDRVTGLVPMYKLIVICLAAIAAVALILSLFGQLAYSPPQLLASLVVALGVAVLTGLPAARLMRTTAHLDSSIITGLLIFAIMQPTIEPLKLLGIALASLIATVSKYLLAVRGRHIFNPAAVGAVIVGVIGLSYPAWWIGTPFLLAVIVIGAFLILFRTQRLLVGLTFLAVAWIVSLLVTLGNGATVADWVQFSVLSSPLVFLAGFMLSEPLTLPPRRWQQLIVAVVVALLVALPISLPLNKFLFALLVGNLIGFVFGQRRAIRMTYLGKTQLSPTTWELAFQPAKPVHFLPGQYMELTIPHRRADFRGSRRYFSISSAPSADAPITFAITVPSKSSSFKQALLDLPPGATIFGTGVGGDFALPARVDEPLLLIAGGIGITPFASQLAYATQRGEKRDVTVVYSSSTPGELPYSGLLAASGARVVVFAPSSPDPLPVGWTYAGPGRVTGERLAETVPDAATRRAFVSGPPALVDDLKKALHTQGVRRVHSDYFSGY